MAQVLNYHDAVIYDTDVGLFGDGGWLNDSCINWFFRVLEHEVFPGRQELLFMDPAVVSCMMNQCDDEEELVDLGRGLDLGSRSMVFVPVNNATGPLSRGSHWSLLVFERETGQRGAAGNNDNNGGSISGRQRFRHFDSSEGSNRTPAELTAAKFSQMLGKSVVGGGDSSSRVEHVRDAPQQSNGFDCGMYTVLLARRLASTAAAATTATATPVRTPPVVVEAEAVVSATVVAAASGESKMPDQDSEAVLELGKAISYHNHDHDDHDDDGQVDHDNNNNNSNNSNNNNDNNIINNNISNNIISNNNNDNNDNNNNNNNYNNYNNNGAESPPSTPTLFTPATFKFKAFQDQELTVKPCCVPMGYGDSSSGRTIAEERLKVAEERLKACEEHLHECEDRLRVAEKLLGKAKARKRELFEDAERVHSVIASNLCQELEQMSAEALWDRLDVAMIAFQLEHQLKQLLKDNPEGTGAAKMVQKEIDNCKAFLATRLRKEEEARVRMVNAQGSLRMGQDGLVAAEMELRDFSDQAAEAIAEEEALQSRVRLAKEEYDKHRAKVQSFRQEHVKAQTHKDAL
eukprot:g6570.t2